MEDFECAHCGKRFLRRKKTNTMCSIECRSAAQIERNRARSKRHYAQKELPPKVCVQCNEEFVPRTRAQIVCSADCRIERQTIQRHRSYDRNKRWHASRQIQPGETDYDRWLRRDLLK